MQIYVNKNGQQLGAFEENVVIQMLKNGQLSANDLGIRQGENQWRTLGQIFPNAINSFAPAPVFNANPPQNYSAPVAPKKSSNGLLIGLLALGGIFLLGVIGIGGLLLVGKSNKPVSLANTSNKVATPAPTPTPVTYTYLTGKEKDFAKLTPPIKLEPKAVLKGKTLMVMQEDKASDYTAKIIGFKYSTSSVDESDLSLYGLTKAKTPTSLEELDTLVQVVCGKGGIVGKFGPITAYVPAYANTCKISLINYKESKIYFQKTIQNAKKPAKIYVRDDEYEHILPLPEEEVKNYIKGLPSA